MELGVLLFEGRAKIENDTRVDAGRGNLISQRTAKWNFLQFRAGKKNHLTYNGIEFNEKCINRSFK
jgi:hypothetical protein